MGWLRNMDLDDMMMYVAVPVMVLAVATLIGVAIAYSGEKNQIPIHSVDCDGCRYVYTHTNYLTHSGNCQNPIHRSK